MATQIKEESMPTTGNVVTAPTGSQAQDNPMNVYGGGDSFGSAKMPKGAEMMRKRAERGEEADNSFTEKGEEGNPYPKPDSHGR